MDCRELDSMRAQEVNSAERLLQRLREADPGAYAELYDRFAPRVHRFATWRLGGDHETAEEITVQVMVEAVRGLHRYEPRRASFLSWLLGITARQTLGEVRRRRRGRRVPPAAHVPLEVADEQVHVSDPASVITERIEAQRQVERLRAHLAPLEMEVLVLQGAYELTAREIGHVLGKSERAINSLLHRARVKARERLVNDGREH